MRHKVYLCYLLVLSHLTCSFFSFSACAFILSFLASLAGFFSFSQNWWEKLQKELKREREAAPAPADKAMDWWFDIKNELDQEAEAALPAPAARTENNEEKAVVPPASTPAPSQAAPAPATCDDNEEKPVVASASSSFLRERPTSPKDEVREKEAQPAPTDTAVAMAEENKQKARTTCDFCLSFLFTCLNVCLARARDASDSA